VQAEELKVRTYMCMRVQACVGMFVWERGT